MTLALSMIVSSIIPAITLSVFPPHPGEALGSLARSVPVFDVPPGVEALPRDAARADG